jgi:hypothetical protein
MAHGNEANDRPRARRVKLAGTVIAVIQLDSGQQVRAKVHQLSATGGVLQIPEPLNESVQVKLLFQLGRTAVRKRAEMLDQSGRPGHACSRSALLILVISIVRACRMTSRDFWETDPSLLRTRPRMAG